MNIATRTGGGSTAVLALLVALALTVPLLAASAEEAASSSNESSHETASGEAAAGEPAEGEPEVQKKGRMEKLEEQIKILAEELEELRTGVGVPKDKKLESFNGLGAYASKVYTKDKGLSIGGYGELRFRKFTGDGSQGKDDIFDAVRAVLYIGYKFNEHWVLNSEIEFEHGGSGAGGSVSTEFLTLDFLFKDELNARGGLVLLPMGLVNEMHEPVFFHGMERPEPERVIIPTTWRENGAGIFGQVFDRVTYRMYAVNGMDATGFSAKGLRGGRQKGGRALANDWAFVGRFDVDVLAGLEMGGSVYTGNSGQEQKNTVCTDPSDDSTCTTYALPGALTTIYELHGVYRSKGLTLKGLFTQAFVNDAGELSTALGLAADESVAEQMLGGYAEIAYDVMPHLLMDTRMSLEPFFRYEYVNTQWKVASDKIRNGLYDEDIFVVGLDFKPIPQVVLKVDYRHFDPREGVRANEVQFGFGYAF